MAIEIRELVIRETVTAGMGPDKGPQYITAADLHKFQDRVADKILNQVRRMIEEERSWR